MRLLLRTAFYTALAGITVLAFLPDYSKLPPVVSVNDLANHAAAFIVLSLLYSLSYSHPPKRIAASLLSYGVFLEAVQTLLPTRYASLEDIAADTAGIITGMGVMQLLKWKKRGTPERGKV